jgi:hypothetical protein
MLAAGYAPQYRERSLDDPEMAAVRDALGRVLAGHEPYPAIAVDKVWNMVASNASLGVFLDGVDPELLQPPVNSYRLALHPDGLAPRILNLGEWRAHLMERLARQITLTGDQRLLALEAELLGYPGPAADHATSSDEIMVELRLLSPDGEELSFFSTVTTFGTAVEITLSELSVEAFFPADATTARALQEQAAVA